MTAPITSAISVIFNNANWALASGVIAFVHWSAQLPLSHYYVPAIDWPSRSVAKICVLDVDAGAAVHIHGRGEDWLLDCGSARDYDRVLRSYLHATGVNRVDGLLLSHGDSLHIGAAETLLADFAPSLLIDNSALDRSTS